MSCRASARRALPLTTLLLMALVSAGGQTAAAAAEIRVPQDASSLQRAIERAKPGDTIVLDAGSYPGGNVVPPAKHDLTIRGVDRNEVVLDGADVRKNGIVVHADGVSTPEHVGAQLPRERLLLGRRRTASAART